MNMDSTPGQTTQNWLGFSLSHPDHRHRHHQHHYVINNTNPPPSSSSSSSSSSDSTHRLSLFEVFHHPSSAPTATAVRTATQDEDDAGRAAGHCIFTGGCGPKLEDFLGGCTANVPPPPHAQAALSGGHLSTDHIHIPVTSNITNAISNSTYDSELKTIASSFLRGFSTPTEQTDPQKQQQQQQQYHQQSQVQTELALKKSIDTFGQRTSIYRGVTRHRWTGRYEAHLWDNSCRREGQSRKGRQVYLGGYDKEEKAARAYDLAALKYWGPTTTTNFPVSNYEKDLEEMKNMTRQEFVASLRRKSSGFSRGASIYRGVTRHHQHGRWQARIGRVAGNKDLYLGTFSTQEEAAEAYDIAAIKFRGLNAVTNFNISRYDVKSIVNSNLPIGGMTTKSKNSSESASDGKSIDGSRSDDLSSASSVTFAPHQQRLASTATLNFAMPIKEDPSDYWSSILGYQINAGCTTLQNAKNNNDGPVAPSTFFQPSNINGYALQFQSPASLRADLKTNHPGSDSGNNSGLFFNPGFIQQQSGSGSAGVSSSGNYTSSSSSLQFATPIALSASSSSYEGNSIYGNWIAQSPHSLQSAKPNLSVFQTPIFGME